MFEWWRVLPDDERPHWDLEPFVRVGPLRFGMSPAETGESLAATGRTEGTTWPRPHGAAADIVVRSEYRGFVDLHFRDERLSGVIVDAVSGPQVIAEGVALVGRTPSVLERWMVDRREAREPDSDLVYLTAGVPGSETLGVVLDVQRAGDHLLTRPVFVPPEALDDLPHWFQRDVWSRY